MKQSNRHLWNLRLLTPLLLYFLAGYGFAQLDTSSNARKGSLAAQQETEKAQNPNAKSPVRLHPAFTDAAR